MDLDKFINDNIDEILTNPNDYVNESNINKKSNLNKKVKFKQDNYNIYHGDDNNRDEYYDNNFDNNSNNFDDENYNESNLYLESNNDEYDDTNDYINELHQDMYEKKFYKELMENNSENINEDNNINNEDNDEYYYLNLINIFIKYYNEKFDKNEHFFSNIKNYDKDTSNQMEMFFDLIFEYKILKDKLKLDDLELMKYIYNENDNKNDNKLIENLFENLTDQIYVMEINNNKLFSPSLIICFNYIYENNLIDQSWNIFNLKNIS